MKFSSTDLKRLSAFLNIDFVWSYRASEIEYDCFTFFSKDNHSFISFENNKFEFLLYFNDTKKYFKFYSVSIDEKQIIEAISKRSVSIFLKAQKEYESYQNFASNLQKG